MITLEQMRRKQAQEKAELNAMGIETSFNFPRGINYLEMPSNLMKPTDDNMEKWNQVIDWLENHGYAHSLVFTKSKGLSKAHPGFGFATRDRRSYLEIVAVTRGGSFRVTFTPSFDLLKKYKTTGRKAFHDVLREFERDGIDLMDYATAEGAAIKDIEIDKPYISVTNSCKAAFTYEHVHHLDLHSAYPSGIAAAHPELKPTIERIYKRRKLSDDGKKLKLELDAAIGFMQSEYCVIKGHGYALANLARDGINWCNAKIRDLSKELRGQGYTPLAFNTDGIWYAKLIDGESIPSEPMHCSLEGDDLGTYATDHIDCTARWKTKGAYEFIENGVYKPVVRGATRLDKIKSRDEWQWGDIFLKAAEVIVYKLDGDMIVVKEGE